MVLIGCGKPDGSFLFGDPEVKKLLPIVLCQPHGGGVARRERRFLRLVGCVDVSVRSAL